MRLRLASVLVVLATALGLGAGCSRKDVAATSPAAGGAKILLFGNGTEPQDLDPQIVTGVPEIVVAASSTAIGGWSGRAPTVTVTFAVATPPRPSSIV